MLRRAIRQVRFIDGLNDQMRTAFFSLCRPVETVCPGSQFTEGDPLCSLSPARKGDSPLGDTNDGDEPVRAAALELGWSQ